MHQHMDSAADGLQERKISLEAAARYACSPNVPPIPARSNTIQAPPRPQPPLPSRQTSLRTHIPPVIRDPPPPPASREIITLDQVRPGPRAQNDYVDSPRWPVQPPSHPHKTLVHPKSLQVPPPADRTLRGGVTHTTIPSGHHDVITSQPSTHSHSTLKKDHSVDTEECRPPPPLPPPLPCQDSIVCSQCGKCRCQACTQPRELPRRWLCNNKCECSAQKCVDVASCLCCARACFYHCFKDSEGDECSASDDPCACCERPHCCKRWTCLGIMSLCLPCLCFYWPLRCGLSCCTSVYNKCSRRGCHCRRDKLPGAKRLLIDSESSST